MPEIVSVALVYPNEKRSVFQVCAEFLRFMGIYVSEYCKLPQDTEERCYNVEDATEAYIDLTEYPKLNVNNSDGQHSILDMLYNELQEYYFPGDFSGTYYLLKDIFITNNLLQAAITLQCFRVDDKLVLDAGDCFKKAAEMLEDEIGNGPLQLELCYLYYAKLYSLQKANLSRYLNHELVEFSIAELSEKCIELLDMVPGLSNVKVLRGMILEKVDSKIGETLEAYEEALQDVGDKYYASSIYYWFGHRCENTDTYREKCKEAYKKAYVIAKKYRNIFKMAIVCKWERNWEKELQYLQDCVNCIDRKGTYLDPLEQEYYFKTNVLIGYIYIYNDKLKDIAKGILYINNALKLRECIQNEVDEERVYTKFYQEVYGKDAKQYVLLALKRMRTERAYEYLVDAFAKVGIRDVEKEYLKLLK